ncbi:MAG: hypothetical protein COZ43_11965 [Sphingomonadales bacterium CG_4_10_14_3_um_filter_58_15]|nr:MAG: hypothetical protein COZ43_11965 [Sphingomonadales bacterium CG_4_10_14_3_um_filter_58_15]
MLRCTIYQSVDIKPSRKEHDMSKRLTTSAIIATLLMAATTFYSTAQLDHQETASTSVLMGG